MKNDGEIKIRKGLGKRIAELSQNREYEIYVETGTMHGNGSTLCFLGALLDRNDKSKLYTFETNPSFYKIACANLKEFDTAKIEYVYGSIVEYSDLPDWKAWNGTFKEDYQYNKDLLAAPYVGDKLPSQIDVLLLDSGGWSRQAEWNKLKDCIKVILLDDTLLSTNHIRDEILKSSQWEVIDDQQDERNGWLCAKRKDNNAL
jgi:hypothetical protein